MASGLVELYFAYGDARALVDELQREKVRSATRRIEQFTKVTRGTNAAELPIEQPTHFELVINLRTATALGLTIPRPILLRASATVR